MVADSSQASVTPALDQWIEEDGEEAVLAAVASLKTAIGDGSVPVVREKVALQVYWSSRRQRV